MTTETDSILRRLYAAKAEIDSAIVHINRYSICKFSSSHAYDAWLQIGFARKDLAYINEHYRLIFDTFDGCNMTYAIARETGDGQ